MHPIFRNKRWLAIYLVSYAALGGMFAASVRAWGGDLQPREILMVAEPAFVFFAFVCLTPWYICLQLPFASTGRLKLLVYHAGAAIVATVLWTALARTIGYTLDLGGRLNPMIPPLVAIGFLLYLLSVALHYALLALEASRRAELEAREAELRALKAQINPHFLFNSLNSIAALTASDPTKAREMCLRLAGFLRQTLGLGECESVAWREELDMAQAYLDVEQIRFGPRLQVEMHSEEACRDCLVPPLILQPLIENAVKHGIATTIEGGVIRIECQAHNGRLKVTVENSFDPESHSSRYGLGLRNLRKRLETRFGAAARIEARAEGNRFLVEMALPFQIAC